MKTKLMILVIALIIIPFLGINLQSADRDFTNLPDAELTKKEAEQRILEFETRVKELQNQLAAVNADVDRLTKELQDVVTKLKDCQEAYKALINASTADLENFRQRLGIIEGKIRRLQPLSNDELATKIDEINTLWNDVNDLKNNKIALLPEFYDRVRKALTDVYDLKMRAKRGMAARTYVVKSWAENRDCLWNIAGNIQIYGDPFLWPKIWQSNTDLIKNPDIIKPGWVLKIPVKADKTPDEIKAERKYWRQKKARMEKEQLKDEMEQKK
mgnify:CR=1 FL=1